MINYGRDRKSSTIASVGIGMALIGIAESMPEHSYLKPIILLLSPMATVVTGIAYQTLIVMVQWKVHEIMIRRELARARQESDALLSSPDISDEMKLKVRHNLEMLQSMVIELSKARMSDEISATIHKVPR